MSANADVLPSSRLVGSVASLPQVRVAAQTSDWTRESFAREQIRGLVRRVFLGNEAQTVKQVVFSAIEVRTDVGGICDQVGRALALETHADVSVVSANFGEAVEHDYRGQNAAIKSWGRQTGANLWHVTESGLREPEEESGTGRYWRARLAELQSEFEYVIVQGPTAGLSSQAALLGQLADGIILVLDAHSTRRATARKIMQTLQGARILGTVLSERAFPIPERIYRRL